MRATRYRAAGTFALPRAIALLALGTLLAGMARPATAIDWKKRFWMGVRIADYLPADEQKGGFRINQQFFATRTERDVKPKETVFGTLSFGYGVKKWEGSTTFKQVQFSLELEISRVETEVGDESGWRDDNASTRLIVPGSGFATLTMDGDEMFESFPVGDLTMTPVFVNGLFHWGSDRAEFYAGGGLGVVFVEMKPNARYLEFVGVDGPGDVNAEDAFATNFKIGSNFRLNQSGSVLLFFEAQYITTQLFSNEAQVQWTGTLLEDGSNGVFLGTKDYDSDNDGRLDTFGHPADLHVVDPGKVRLDSATLGMGVRYRFGKRAKKPAEPTAGGF